MRLEKQVLVVSLNIIVNDTWKKSCPGEERREILKNKREILKNKKEILKNNPIPREREGISLPLSASESILAIPGCWQHKGGSWRRESNFGATHRPKAKEGSAGLALAWPGRPSVLQTRVGFGSASPAPSCSL